MTRRATFAATACGLLFVAFVQGAVGVHFHRAAAAASPRGAEAGFPLDDAWIHLVYARSFAERLRPDYDPGHPEAGQSSLLWGVLLAPGHAAAGRAGVPVGAAVRAFGVAVWIALAFAAWWFVRGLPIPGARTGAFLAAMLVGLDPALAFTAVSGMEPLLLALFAVLAFGALARGRPSLAGAFAGLAALSRPEGVLVVAVVPVCAALLAKEHRVHAAAVALVPAAAACCVWVATCLAITGRPLPNTFYVKADALPAAAMFAQARALGGVLLSASPYYAIWPGLLFPAIGAVSLAARCPKPLGLAFLLLPVLLVLGVAASRPIPQADAFFWERYVVPAAAWCDVVAAAGFGAAAALLLDLVRKQGGTPGTMIPEPVLAAILFLVALLPFLHVAEFLEARAEAFARNVHDVDAMNVAAATWLAEHADPAGVTVGAQDAGAVRYFLPAQHRVVDLIGLNDHRLVTAGLAHDGDIGPYLAQRNPTVLFLLDPDPGALPFAGYAAHLGLVEVHRATVEAYSPFGPPIPKAIVVLAPREMARAGRRRSRAARAAIASSDRRAMRRRRRRRSCPSCRTSSARGIPRRATTPG